MLAIFATGVSSVLCVDDFLVAFSVGATFSRDGVFAEATRSSNLANIIDLLPNSTMFMYFGAVIPWEDFVLLWPGMDVLVTLWRLFSFLVLVLFFRRVPAVLLLQRWIPDIKTCSKASFAGHFGPMGVGALFISVGIHIKLPEGERASLIGGETHGIEGMIHSDGEEDV